MFTKKLFNLFELTTTLIYIFLQIFIDNIYINNMISSLKLTIKANVDYLLLCDVWLLI